MVTKDGCNSKVPHRTEVAALNAPVAAGATFTQTLTIAGTYQYECSLHPTNMHGTIIVRSA